MAGLLENDKTQAPDAPPAEATAPAPDVVAEPAAPVVDPVVRACASCASPLADDQDWCLECGSAQPGRLGARAGWRAAGTVVAACVLLATGAGAAAYAALSSESQRVASAPAPPAAAPVVAQPPAVPAPPPELETPSVAAPDSDAADLPAVEAPESSDDSVDTPSSSSGTSADAGDTADDDADSGGAGSGSDAAAEEKPIDLSADAASTYDPFDRGKGDVGDPADAVDGKDGTAWEAPVAGDGLVRIGLAVSLDQARTLSRVAFKADTPGFTVEVYGTRAASLPSTITSKKWENLGVKKDVGIDTEFDVNGKFRHVVVWVTAMDADTKVAIPEIQLYD